MNNFVKIYGIKNCDTVKKALNYMIDNDVSYEFIDMGCSVLSKTSPSKIRSADCASLIDSLVSFKKRFINELVIIWLNSGLVNVALFLTGMM